MRHLRQILPALFCAVSLSCGGDGSVTPQPKPDPPKVEWSGNDPISFVAGSSANVHATVTASSCSVTATPQGLTITPVSCSGTTLLNIGVSGVVEGNFSLTLHVSQNGVDVQSSRSVLVERKRIPELQTSDTTGILNQMLLLAPSINGDVDGCRARIIGAAAVSYGPAPLVQDRLVEVAKCRYELTLGNYVLRDGVASAEIEVEGYSTQTGASSDFDTVHVQRVVPNASDIVLSGEINVPGGGNLDLRSASRAFIVSNGEPGNYGTMVSMADPIYDPIGQPSGSPPTYTYVEPDHLITGVGTSSGCPPADASLVLYVTNTRDRWNGVGR
jgi:hypothetical protein